MQVQSLAPFSGLRIWRCCELWCRLAAEALIQPLARELPYTVVVALKRGKKKERKVYQDNIVVKADKQSLIGLISIKYIKFSSRQIVLL